jgi:hypothetical protein
MAKGDKKCPFCKNWFSEWAISSHTAYCPDNPDNEGLPTPGKNKERKK